MIVAVRAGCIAAALTVLTMAPSHAQPSPGIGGVLCRDYLRAARSSDILYYQASNWLLGYVSGMNAAMATMNGAAPQINLSHDQLLKSAGDYCEANPTRTIANAAAGWSVALPKPQQAQSGSLIINLDRAPDRKPLLDRR